MWKCSNLGTCTHSIQVIICKKKPTSFKVDCTQSCVFLSFLQAADIIIPGCTLHSGSLIASSSSRLCVLYAMACGQERESWTILTDYMKMNETKSKNKMKWRQFRHFEYYCTIISLWFSAKKKRNIYLSPPFFLHEQRGKWTMTVVYIKTESAIAR
jgi:hypothetical protein